MGRKTGRRTYERETPRNKVFSQNAPKQMGENSDAKGFPYN